MTVQEFESRTGVRVGSEEFNAIHIVYNASDLDKDEFCKMWCKMNKVRIARIKAAFATIDAKRRIYDSLWEIENRTVGSNAMVRNKVSAKDIETIEEAGIKVNPEWNMWTLKGHMAIRRGELEEQITG